jgi:hypothetical protein
MTEFTTGCPGVPCIPNILNKYFVNGLILLILLSVGKEGYPLVEPWKQNTKLRTGKDVHHYTKYNIILDKLN